MQLTPFIAVHKTALLPQRCLKRRRWTTCSSQCSPSGWPVPWNVCRACCRSAPQPRPLGRWTPRWNNCARCSRPLRMIHANVGQQIRFVPVEEVLVFEAADKYVRVLTAEGEVLIRTPLKDVLPQLDAGVFWQIHRGTVVRASAIHSVHRDEAGKLSLQLRDRPEHWPVSRLYAQRFRAM